MTRSRQTLNRAITMFSLILAGEAIFCLPFHIARYFRPTFVDVFEITQPQLGMLGSTYGVVAMLSYILGGPLADRFPARKLLAFALLATGVPGLYLTTIPSFPMMFLLFGFWGMSTILPFWAALIRAAREWGGHDEQGIAFGILDGGRGLLAAVLATVALLFFSRFMPEVGGTLAEKTAALRSTMFVYTTTCLVAAVFTWLFVPDPDPEEVTHRAEQRRSGHLKQVLRMPVVWLQAFIILCAYCAYKGGDFYSQYASDVWKWSDVDAASVSALSVWTRPFAAIAAGILADRLSSSRVITGCFVITAAAYLSFIFAVPGENLAWLLWVNVLASCVGIFALRGIYFALMEESSIPRRMTGTAVGVVSFIGYTPEIFMPLLGSWLIRSGDARGYRILFAFLLVVSIASVVATLVLRRTTRKGSDEIHLKPREHAHLTTAAAERR